MQIIDVLAVQLARRFERPQRNSRESRDQRTFTFVLVETDAGLTGTGRCLRRSGADADHRGATAAAPWRSGSTPSKSMRSGDGYLPHGHSGDWRVRPVWHQCHRGRLLGHSRPSGGRTCSRAAGWTAARMDRSLRQRPSLGGSGGGSEGSAERKAARDLLTVIMGRTPPTNRRSNPRRADPYRRR